MLNNTDLDLAIACALVANGASVELMLIVVRPQVLHLAGEKDMIVKVFRHVATLRADKAYALAFAAQPTTATSAPYTPSRKRSSLRESLARFLDDLRAKIKTWWASVFLPPPPSAISAIAAPATTSPPKIETDSNLPTIISTPVRYAGMESSACGATMDVRLTCIDGRLVDAQGLDRGACVYCGVNSTTARSG
jgi:hypothetical protein